MRLFKKFLLAAGAVGLISTLGFAGQVKADPGVEDVEFDDEGSLSWTADEDEYDVIGKIEVSIGGLKVFTEESEDGVFTDDLDSEEIDQAIKGSASSSSAASVSGKAIVTIYCYMQDDNGDIIKSSEKKASGESGNPMPYTYYKQTVTSADFSKGSIYVDGTPSSSPVYFYAKLDDTYTIDASPSGSNTFNGWKEDSTLKDSFATITVKKSATYTAQFGVNLTDIYLTGKVGNKTYTDGVTMNVGDSITFDYQLYPNGAQGKSQSGGFYCSDDSCFSRTSLKVWKATKASTYPVEVYMQAQDLNGNLITSNILRITINEQAYTESKFEIKCDNDYLTDSYKMDLTPNFTVKGTYTTGIVWEVVKGDVKLTGLNSSSSTGTKVTDDKGVEVTATEGKVSSGNTSEVEIKATLPKGKSPTENLVVTYKFTVYPKNTLTYSSSDRNLKYVAPAKVNTGKTDGQDTSSDDTKKQTRTAISDIKGVKLQVFKGDESLGTTSTAKSKGTSATIDRETVEQIITNLSSKFSGDSATVKFRAYPCRDDDNTTYNKNVYADASTTVYRVEVTTTDADGIKSTEVYYGLEGQVIDFTKNTALKGYTINDKDGKTVTTATVKTSFSDNKYTGVLGERKETDGSGLDKVPKTGQNNVFVYVMVAIVACAVCFGLYAYNKKSKNA